MRLTCQDAERATPRLEVVISLHEYPANSVFAREGGATGVLAGSAALESGAPLHLILRRAIEGVVAPESLRRRVCQAFERARSGGSMRQRVVLASVPRRDR